MRTGNTEHVDEHTLIAWVVGAQPRARLVYALGDLASDRGQPYRRASTTMLDAVARLVADWQRVGLVVLYQKRTAQGFAYVVERRAVAARVGLGGTVNAA